MLCTHLQSNLNLEKVLIRANKFILKFNKGIKPQNVEKGFSPCQNGPFGSQMLNGQTFFSVLSVPSFQLIPL
jgi:hypothetical protein